MVAFVLARLVALHRAVFIYPFLTVKAFNCFSCCSLLQNNNITGPIPAQFGKLARLRKLNLSSNHLFGEIPSSVSNLDSLQFLGVNGGGYAANLYIYCCMLE